MYLDSVLFEIFSMHEYIHLIEPICPPLLNLLLLQPGGYLLCLYLKIKIEKVEVGLQQRLHVFISEFSTSKSFAVTAARICKLSSCRSVDV